MKGKLIAWLLAAVLIVSCLTVALAEEAKFGPIYDEWSEKTDEELYEEAKAEGGELTVYANQPAGSETLVSLQAGGSDFLAKQLGLVHYQINQQLFVQIAPEKINVYDAKSTRLIKRARADESDIAG